MFDPRSVFSSWVPFLGPALWWGVAVGRDCMPRNMGTAASSAGNDEIQGTNERPVAHQKTPKAELKFSPPVTATFQGLRERGCPQIAWKRGSTNMDFSVFLCLPFKDPQKKVPSTKHMLKNLRDDLAGRGFSLKRGGGGGGVHLRSLGWASDFDKGLREKREMWLWIIKIGK